jgi:glutamate decarboxylase
MSTPQEILAPHDEFNLSMSEREFPCIGMSARAAAAFVISDEWTDTNPQLNMSSFEMNFAEPEVMETAKRNFLKNYVDHDMHPQLFAMETRMVRWLHALWNGPKNVEPYGMATVGSSEACLLAGLAHKWNWRRSRTEAGKDASRPNLVTGGNVQIVWKKFMRYFDVEPRIVPLAPGKYRLTAEDLNHYVDENTIAVVAIAGQVFTGEDDDFAGIHAWLDDYERRTGVSIPMHIDAASGGFVHPFLYPDYRWDFRLPRVQSINASGHKYGLTPPGLGWLIFRERKVFNDELVFHVNYHGGEMPTTTLNFSRNAFQIAVQYYQFLRLGFDGYRRVMRQTLDNALALREQLVGSGYFDILNDTQHIPVVAVKLAKHTTQFNEFDVSNKVREKGWLLSAYAMPPNAETVRALRVVVRPHLSHNVTHNLGRDIIGACQFLAQHGGKSFRRVCTTKRMLAHRTHSAGQRPNRSS